MESTPYADDKVADIVELRRLHDEMDRAVLRAFGWDDLAKSAKAQFLTEENEDDPKYKGRLFWPAEFRAEVLSRLLALNAEQYAAEEEALGATGKKKAPAARVKDRNQAELLEQRSFGGKPHSAEAAWQHANGSVRFLASLGADE